MPVTLIATQTLGTHGPALAFGQFGYGSTGGFLTQGTDGTQISFLVVRDYINRIVGFLFFFF